MPRGHLPVHGVHDEEISIICPKVDVVGSRRERRHVEITVVAHREVLSTPVSPRPVLHRYGIPSVSMTGEGLNGIKGAQGSRVTRDMHIVVYLSGVSADHPGIVVVFLIVDPVLSEIRTVSAGSQLINGHEGRLDDRYIRVAVRIIRVKVLGYLEAVGSTIIVGVHIEWIGAGVSRAGEGSSASLHAIEQAVSVTVRIRRVRPRSLLLAIVGSVLIGIRHSWVGSVNVFLRITDTIFIEVARAKLGQVPGKELLLVSIGDAVAVGIKVRIKAVEIDPPAQPCPISIKFRRNTAADSKDAGVADPAEVRSVGGEVIVIAESDISRGLGAPAILGQPDVHVEPASSTKVKVGIGSHVPGHVGMLLIVAPGIQVGCRCNWSGHNLDSVIVVLSEGEHTILVVELEHIGEVVVVAQQIRTKPTRFPVDINSLKKKRVRVIQLPERSKLIDVLGKGSGKVCSGEVVCSAIENSFRGMVDEIDFRL